MQVHLWGVRGSIASGGADAVRYGCNTSCYVVKVDEAPHIIFDAGSGIRDFGSKIHMESATKECALFLSHGHWDHVSGLPFFEPLYVDGWNITIYAPESIGGVGAERFLKELFSSAFFPVTWDDLRNKPRIVPLHDKQCIELAGGVQVTAHASNHGGKKSQGLYAAAFRITHKNHSIFYSGDHELGEDLDSLDKDSSFFQGMRGADIAIVDSQFTTEDYKKYKGWGHSSIEQWPSLMQEMGVKTFVPVHYAPSYTDSFLDGVSDALVMKNPYLASSLCMGFEGLVLQCADTHTSPHVWVSGESSCDNCTFSSKLMNIPDMSSVLDNLLLKAREVCKADAGTIYLVEEGELVFSYSHNDTLFTSSQSARQQYLNARLPLNQSSIAGYVACNRTVLNLADVRKLPEGAPYSFNGSFDKATGYKTVSICALPIVTQEGELLAVMQIINATHNGEPVPFTHHAERQLRELCFVGAQAIEQAVVTQDMLLCVLETTRMRDPTETGPHVFRVGAMAAELYHHWAAKRGVDLVDIFAIKAHLRLASMLHDVGKVGISDKVLKKPGRFTPEERAIMEKHCVIGSAIFEGINRTLDQMAAVIALHHHQRWDGKGYTGTDAPALAGEDIPYEARITSVVDVFDALISPRCYKEPMPLEQALDILRKDSGTAFDPEMVECFMEILETILSIQEKYQEIPIMCADGTVEIKPK